MLADQGGPNHVEAGTTEMGMERGTPEHEKETYCTDRKNDHENKRTQ